MKPFSTHLATLMVLSLVVLTGCGTAEDEDLAAINRSDAPVVARGQADWKGATESVEHMLRTQDLNPQQEKALRQLLFDLKSSAADASRAKH